MVNMLIGQHTMSVTFGLVHGSWQGEWSWDLVVKEFEGSGFQVHTVDLPGDDPDATFEDHADIAAKAFDGIPNLVLVGHSRGGNILPRIANRIEVKRMVFVSSAFHDATLRIKDEPKRYSDAYLKGIKKLVGSSLMILDESVARRILYDDCTPEIAEWAINQLRAQKRSGEEPELKTWPNIPTDYVICRQDKVVNPEWSHYVSQKYLNVQPVYLDSGHSPLLSQPRNFAQLMVKLARK